MITNYKSLKYFMTIKKLLKWQARWANFLLRLNFVISYTLGRENGKATSLIREPNDLLTDN